MSGRQVDALAFYFPPEANALTPAAEAKIRRLIEMVGDQLERIAIGEQDLELPLTVAGAIFARAAVIRGRDDLAFYQAAGRITGAYLYYRDRQKAAGHAATAEAPPP